MLLQDFPLDFSCRDQNRRTELERKPGRKSKPVAFPQSFSGNVELKIPSQGEEVFLSRRKWRFALFYASWIMFFVRIGASDEGEEREFRAKIKRLVR